MFTLVNENEVLNNESRIRSVLKLNTSPKKKYNSKISTLKTRISIKCDLKTGTIKQWKVSIIESECKRMEEGRGSEHGNYITSTHGKNNNCEYYVSIYEAAKKYQHFYLTLSLI